MGLSVAIVAHTHYRVDARVRQQAELLARRGDRVVAFCLDPDARPDSLGGVDLEPLPLSSYEGSHVAGFAKGYLGFAFKAGVALTKSHLRKPFDVVVVHTPVDFLASAAMFPKLTGARVVLDLRERTMSGLRRKFSFGDGGRMARLARNSERLSAIAADVVVARDPLQYQALLDARVPARKLAVHLDFADPHFFPAKKKWSKKPSGVIWHGELRREMGVELALRVFSLIRAERDTVRFSVIGRGAHEAQFKALAQELGLGNDVLSWVDDVSLESVGQSIQSHDVGLYVPSAEAPSRPPVELIRYLEMGVLPISVRSRAAEAIASNEAVEFCLPVASSLAGGVIRVLDDRDRRTQMLSARDEWISEFGFGAQEKILLRTMDALCLEKILREKKAMQRAAKGTGTGGTKAPKKEPEAPNANAPKEKGKNVRASGAGAHSSKAQPSTSC